MKTTSRVLKGAGAGLVAGAVYGLVLQMMAAPIPGGRETPVMVLLAKLLGSQSLAVGWLFHLVHTAVLGAIFGWSFGWLLEEATVERDYEVVSIWGGAYGFLCWIVGALTFAPVALGPIPLLDMLALDTLAVGSLLGHVIYGLVLGAGFTWLSRQDLRGSVGRTTRSRA